MILIQVYTVTMAFVNKQKKNSTNTRSSRVNVHEKKFNSLWNVFTYAPRHSRHAFIAEQLHNNGAGMVPDKYGHRHTIVNKRRNARMSKLAYMSVGSIVHIGYDKMDLLSYIPPSPVKIGDNEFARITRSFGQYDVYPISNGTTIGMYWYNDAWILRTTNGFDVGEYKWDGGRTYQSVFDEVMSGYKDFSMDRLEKNKCYTIGIQHSEFHAFKEGKSADIKNAWFIQSVDVKKVTEQKGSFANAVSKTEDIGIPIQAPIVNMSMRDIMVKKANAYKTYVETGEVFYGVLLISPYESIAIQSNLFEYIIDIFYSNVLNKYIKAGCYSRQRYLTLNAFLNSINASNFEHFVCLFPQFDKTIVQFKNTTNKLVEAMIKRIEEKTSKTTTANVEHVGYQLIFNNTVESLLQQLSNRAGGLPKLDMNVARMITRFVRSTSHIATLYDLMYYEDETSSIIQPLEECSLQTPSGDTSPIL
jgi:hypothetical protein